MLEFNPDMDLIFVNEEGEIVEHAMVKELLRSSFTKENLNE
jgi:cytidine deaminase